MAKLSSLIHIYARMGAQARLAELQAEIAAIEREFPELSQRRRPGRPRGLANTDDGTTLVAGQPRKRKRRKMSAAARKAIGDAQRKRWAKQKAADKHAGKKH